MKNECMQFSILVILPCFIQSNSSVRLKHTARDYLGLLHGLAVCCYAELCMFELMLQWVCFSSVLKYFII